MLHSRRRTKNKDGEAEEDLVSVPVIIERIPSGTNDVTY